MLRTRSLTSYRLLSSRSPLPCRTMYTLQQSSHPDAFDEPALEGLGELTLSPSSTHGPYPRRLSPSEIDRLHGIMPRETPEELRARFERTTKALERVQALAARKGGEGGRLEGMVGVITGVGSLKGIGRATALRMAREGARRLYLVDFDGSNFSSLESEVTQLGTKATLLQGDAADPALISEICKRAVKEEGRLDFFFANAGIAPHRPMQSLTAEQFMETLRVNTLSCFLAIQHASEAMQHLGGGKDVAGGSIILTASVAGIRSGAGPIDYSASKAAVVSLAKVGAYQLTGKGVRVNAICPGLIESGMTVAVFDAAKAKGTAGKIGQLNPLQRYGIAEEVAQVALFLASEESSYVNGQDIAVDGALSASHPYVPGSLA